MQLLTQTVLATQGQNQTLLTQQVLTPSTIHNASTPQLLGTPSVRKLLHYSQETIQKDIPMSPTRGHSCHYDTHV